jgi:GTP-binding protein EngB required for normal cell division
MAASDRSAAERLHAEDACHAGRPASSIGHLAALIPLAESLGSMVVAGELQRLVARLRAGHVYLACLGQFKRGKSTLINAMLGEAVLPTGVTPVTSVVTVVKHGVSDDAEVQLLDGTSLTVSRDAIADYVTERHNPGNRKGVAVVTVSIPSPLLGGGLCLVDTPGVGSVVAENSLTTRRFLPQVDAILFVVGADPPVSGDELDMLAQVSARTRELAVVLNKADRVSATDLGEAATFTERVVTSRLGRPTGPPLCVSATEHLAGQVTRDWPAVVAWIRRIAASSNAVLQRSAERHVLRLALQLQGEVREQREALTRPLRDSETRLGEIRTLVREAELALHDLHALLALEQERLGGQFATWRKAFLDRARPQARQEIEQALETLRQRAAYGPSLELARHIARSWVLRWYEDREPEAGAEYAKAMARYTDRARALIRHVGSLMQADTDAHGSILVDGPALTMKVDFYFIDMLSYTGLGFLEWLVDTAGPPRLARALARRRTTRYLDQLIVTNSARVINDFSERVLKSRRALERDIRTNLHLLVSGAERAFDRAQARHAEGAGAVRDALAQLESTDQQLLVFTDRRDAGASERMQEGMAS